MLNFTKITVKLVFSSPFYSSILSDCLCECILIARNDLLSL